MLMRNQAQRVRSLAQGERIRMCVWPRGSPHTLLPTSALHTAQHVVAQSFVAGSPVMAWKPRKDGPRLWILCTQLRVGTEMVPTSVWQMGKNLDLESWRPFPLVSAIMKWR